MSGEWFFTKNEERVICEALKHFTLNGPISVEDRAIALAIISEMEI